MAWLGLSSENLWLTTFVGSFTFLVEKENSHMMFFILLWFGIGFMFYTDELTSVGIIVGILFLISACRA